MEIWKDIIGFEGLYQISNYGNVKSLSRSYKRKGHVVKIHERILALTTNKVKYPQVNLYDADGNITHIQVHRLVALHFVPAVDGKDCVNHIDGNKTNNNWRNLEWCTRAENIEHANRTGLMDGNKGSKRKSAKVNDTAVREIRSLHKNLGLQLFHLSSMYGVSRVRVRKIVNKVAWTHVN